MSAASVAYGQFTVGATAARVVSGQSIGKGVRVRNTHATQVLYVGDANVTAATGYPIPAGQAETLPNYVGDLYAISTAAGTTGGFLSVS